MYFRSKHSAGTSIFRWWRASGGRQAAPDCGGNAGRLDVLRDTGHSTTAAVRRAVDGKRGAAVGVREWRDHTISANRIGPPLVFERLWRDIGCRAVIDDALAERAFEFPVERAIFLTVLHRLMDPDRTGPPSAGATPMPSTAWPDSICTISIGRWPGWARSWPTRAARAWWRAPPRI